MNQEKRQAELQNMSGPRRLIESKRDQLEALRRGEGIHPERRPDPEELKYTLKGIEYLIDYAERVYRRIKNQEDINFFHALIELAQANLYVARYTPHIVKDSQFIADRRKPRGSRWPELDDWIQQHLKGNAKATVKELWHRLPDSYEGDSFYRDGGDLIEMGTERTLTFSGFQKRVRAVKTKNSAR